VINFIVDVCLLEFCYIYCVVSTVDVCVSLNIYLRIPVLCTVYCMCTTVEIPCDCTTSDLAAVKTRWAYVVGRMSAARKVDLFQTVEFEIAKYDADVVELMKTEFLKLGQNSPAVAADLFVKYVSQLLIYYPDVDQLTAYIQYDADSGTFTALARAYGNSPLIARSIVT